HLRPGHPASDGTPGHRPPPHLGDGHPHAGAHRGPRGHARPARSGASRVSALGDKDKRYVWHPFTQMQDWLADEPLVIERAEGSWLFDTTGRRYLDGVSSLWVTVHGHRRPEIDAAIRAQLDRVAHSTLLGLANVPSIELAERLVRIAPPGLDKVFYSDSGSTAVEVALQMAFHSRRQRARPGN